MTAIRRHLGSEGGETLVELLMTIAIIMVAATAVLGALATSISASGQHRRIAALDTVLKSYAENAKYQIQLNSSPAFACPPPSAYSTLPWTPPVGYTPADGYGVSITAVQYWDGAATPPGFDAAGPCTNGLQLLTISATGPASGVDTMQVVVRSPTFSQADAGF